VLSLQLGTSSAASRPVASRRRASATVSRTTVSSTGPAGPGRPALAPAAVRKLISNGALCAVSTAPWAKSRKLASAAAGGGAAAIILSVIPVSASMSGGMARPGLTRVLNSARICPPLIRTAPISVMPASSGDQPVVSTSTITNSSASNACRLAQGWRSRPRTAATQSQMITMLTVGPGTDSPAQARRPGRGRWRVLALRKKGLGGQLS
jgi:hypothetical protein